MPRWTTIAVFGGTMLTSSAGYAATWKEDRAQVAAFVDASTAAAAADDNPVPWSRVGPVLAFLARTCVDYDLDEFERRECAEALDGMKAAVREALQTASVYEARGSAAFGEYDFDRQVFPRMFAPAWMAFGVVTDPPGCLGAVADDGLCLFVGKPSRQRVRGLAEIKGGIVPPWQADVHVLRASVPWTPTSEVPPDVAKEARAALARTEGVMSARVTFRWTWAADRCAAGPDDATKSYRGHCWGEVEVVRLEVEPPGRAGPWAWASR